MKKKRKLAVKENSKIGVSGIGDMRENGGREEREYLDFLFGGGLAERGVNVCGRLIFL
jgi:hypothetical protein